MSDTIEFWEKPVPGKCMIAGWHQWADAGDVSSGLPQYLIEQTQARKIGEMGAGEFYLFQMPGLHHLVRPLVRLNEGQVEELERRQNEFFHVGDDGADFVIFLGQEPHRNEASYAAAFFDAVEELAIKRVAAVAGVHGPVPYERDREVSCVYSLPRMKRELDRYAVRFSNYEGGATISMYLARQAAARGIEFFRFCASVPSYDFSKPSVLIQPMGMEEDFKAWYDLMIRLSHMFGLDLELSDLKGRGEELISSWDSQIERLARTMPQLEVRSYMEKMREDFTERPFVPLSEVWEEGLEDLFDDDEE
jgi:proteasome assembly chaperone (PAC2) family protein